MGQHLVSVIIPTYNRAEYLRQAIESVLAQSYKNFELLVLDNCSPDHTPDVVASFNDHRIKYLRHQCNIGAFANWTYGVFLAKGKYLSILGDDDIYKPDFLTHRIAVMEPDQSIVSSFGQFEAWDGGSELTGRIFNPDVDNIRHSIPLYGVESIEAVVKVQFVGASLYRTAAVHAVWHRIQVGGKAADTMLNIMLATDSGNKVLFILESDLLYRLHSGQDTSTNTKQVCEDAVGVFELAMRGAVYRDARLLYRKYYLSYMDMVGRFYLDANETTLAARWFWESIKVSPFHFNTWLNLLRCHRRNLSQIKLKMLKWITQRFLTRHDVNPDANLRERFSQIYFKNIIRGKDSRSGSGSDMVQTAEIRLELPRLIQEYGIKTFMDAPCGDWHWMKDTALNVEHYIGVDIVEPLIEANRKQFGNNGTSFLCLDLVADELPKVDIIFCRDCLVHLTHDEIRKVIANFKMSGSTYLLTTTFTDRPDNVDLVLEHIWRPLNLEKAPFNFPKPVKVINEKCTEDNNQYTDKSLGLWRLNEIN